MWGRNYPIWVDVDTDQPYSNSKSFGGHSNIELTVRVGSMRKSIAILKVCIERKDKGIMSIKINDKETRLTEIEE